MIVNEPSTRVSLEAAFQRYEKALTGNDLAVLDELFLDARETIRYGITENLYGIEEIRAFRAARPATSLERQLARTEITTYGDSFGIASTLFRRASAPGKIGRQMQTWIRTSEGWRVAAAHVSMIDEGQAKPPDPGSNPQDTD